MCGAPQWLLARFGTLARSDCPAILQPTLARSTPIRRTTGATSSKQLSKGATSHEEAILNADRAPHSYCHHGRAAYVDRSADGAVFQSEPAGAGVCRGAG